MSPARLGSALAVAALLLPAGAAPAQNGLDNLVGIATMTGSCERMALPDRDLTRECAGRIGNSVHGDGRSGFAFFTDRAVISFAGQDSAAIGDRATLHVDEVIISRTDTGATPRPQVIRATGACIYTNPYAGVSTITCDAAAREGRYSARFRSDGRPPDVQRFDRQDSAPRK